VSRGRWSCEGLLAQSETLDTPGLLARSVEDLVPAFAVVDGAPPAWSAELPRREVAGLRIGIVARPFLEDCSPGVVEGVQAALAELGRAGARLVDLALPEAEPAFELWREGHLSAPEAYATLATRFAEWLPTLDPNVRARIETFGAMSAVEYIERRRRVLAWMDAVDQRLAGIDVIATPTIAITAPALEEVAEPDGYRRHNVAASRNAAILSLFDVCAITLPVALDAAGVPVGLQLAGRRGRERGLMALAAAAERVLGTARQRLGTPPLLAGS
jgi:aspartyl-tRNA(Asn)/glutamyl-tRNA(Gln) amidotransferase subunit A